MANFGNEPGARLKNVVRRDAAAVKKPRRGLLKLGLILAAAGLVFGGGWLFWENEIRFSYPIRYVRIESSARHLSEDEFTKAIAPLVRSGLLDADLAAIESVAKTFAWVQRVRVVRRWPDTLILQVDEHRPVARWNEDDLVSERGKRFTPPSVKEFAELPRLYGQEGQENAVLDVWRKLNELLRERKWRVTTLSCNFRKSWSARLSDGKELILGRQDPVSSVARLLGLLPELGARQTAAIKKVDLRYRNGFAVVLRFDKESEPVPVSDEQDGPKPEVMRRLPGKREPSRQLAANQW
ncbi:MAG: cell division protein FtsQ/DivIB [Methylotetracoccus sp.]|jgi:cell division protein FtsQ|nr:cell division protein FtsQ/DivIB [Methylotetracoccus sp.]